MLYGAVVLFVCNAATANNNLYNAACTSLSVNTWYVRWRSTYRMLTPGAQRAICHNLHVSYRCIFRYVAWRRTLTVFFFIASCAACRLRVFLCAWRSVIDILTCGVRLCAAALYGRARCLADAIMSPVLDDGNNSDIALGVWAGVGIVLGVGRRSSRQRHDMAATAYARNTCQHSDARHDDDDTRCATPRCMPCS
ncbi:hypothetical protein TNCT_192321 [Trichonephila clavata]|uniref:Uncharacterized protein n=1 Tax=Trichonephila clavata TaxID=2740835 RepID=A0A8X6G5N9_TRICU|nr:hypothetical protein TNCT_192321 [Trichonephila clavata]